MIEKYLREHPYTTADALNPQALTFKILGSTNF